MSCEVCDTEYPKRLFSHKICKCEICDVCISKHDGNKCAKCKKAIKKDLLKKYQIDIANNLCTGCKLKIPETVDKSCDCKICLDCVYESPISCKSCGRENYLNNKTLETEISKKNIILTFLKEKLVKVTEFEEGLIQDIQEIYKIIEKAKNQYLKEIEGIKRVISDNIKNLADLTLLRCLTLPKSDLEYSISQALILNIKTSFDLKHLEEFFTQNFYANFSIEVPVCYKCHQHLFIKPAKLTGCDCRICKDCIIRCLSSLPNCPYCSEPTSNIEELELYCGEKLQHLCKACYQSKTVNLFYHCPKGCLSCFDCLKKYLDPEPQCPICSLALSSKDLESVKGLEIVS